MYNIMWLTLTTWRIWNLVRKLLCILAAMLIAVTPGTVRAEGLTFEPVIEYEGVTYKARADRSLDTVLLIGYDHKDNGELIKNLEGFNRGGQSDFLLLLVIDHEARKIRMLQMERDTITPVKTYSQKGSYYGTRRMQICLSHAYGDTQELNNRNAVWAVENLLGIAGDNDGAQIEMYLAMDITGIDRLNDVLGGVTVPINDDFSYYDETMVQGTTMTLNGAQAQIYCRQRYYIGDQSNKSRMARQHVYMEAAIQQLRSRLKADANYPVKLLNGMGVAFDKTRENSNAFDFSAGSVRGTPVTNTPTHYLMTNSSLSAITAMMIRAVNYEVGEVETLPGTYRIGIDGHMEFIMEKNAGFKWVLDVLYKPAD